jgi:hypothetical protein
MARAAARRDVFGLFIATAGLSKAAPAKWQDAFFAPVSERNGS